MRGFCPTAKGADHIPHDQCTMAGNQGKQLRKCPEREQRVGLRVMGFRRPHRAGGAD